jgi:Leucine-rich repeat (LRR) protein
VDNNDNINVDYDSDAAFHNDMTCGFNEYLIRYLIKVENQPESGLCHRITQLVLNPPDAYLNLYDKPALPARVGNLQELKFLQIVEMDIARIFDDTNSHPSSVEPWPPVFPNLEKLDLFRMDLICLPPNLGSWSCLRQIILSDLPLLPEIPESISSLKQLEDLIIEGCNSLQHLPSTFGELEFLQTLTVLHGVPLQTIPHNFGNLRSLKYLGINFSTLSELPESFGNLQCLAKLHTGFGPFQFKVPVVSALKYVKTQLSNVSSFAQGTVAKKLRIYFDGAAEEMSEHCHHLQHWMNLEEIIIDKKRDCKVPIGIKLWCPNLSQLHSLYIGRSPIQTQDFDAMIIVDMEDMSSLRHLTELLLDNCKLVASKKMSKSSDNCDMTMVFPSLRHLSLERLQEGAELLKFCRAPHLTKLKVTSCQGLNDNEFDMLCVNMIAPSYGLEALTLRKCQISRITPCHIQAFAEAGVVRIAFFEIPFLFVKETVDRHEELDEKILPIARGCPSLLHLDANFATLPQTNFALNVNQAKTLILGGQPICAKGLWADILACGTRCFEIESPNGNSRVSLANATYVLLRERGALELFGANNE